MSLRPEPGLRLTQRGISPPLPRRPTPRGSGGATTEAESPSMSCDHDTHRPPEDRDDRSRPCLRSGPADHERCESPRRLHRRHHVQDGPDAATGRPPPARGPLRGDYPYAADDRSDGCFVRGILTTGRTESTHGKPSASSGCQGETSPDHDCDLGARLENQYVRACSTSTTSAPEQPCHSALPDLSTTTATSEVTTQRRRRTRPQGRRKC